MTDLPLVVATATDRSADAQRSAADAADSPLAQVLAGLMADRSQAVKIAHVANQTAREAEAGAWPAFVPQRALAAFRERGITVPWRHQQRAAELAWAGRSTVVATGTASGKSLAYQLPAVSAALAGETTLYLSPTKALAADQHRFLTALALAEATPAAYDGDCDREDRDWARAHASIVLTNPEMLHLSVLPGHERWASWLRRLRFVVVDECHAYRGVFGAHVAAVLRRLRRVAAGYGADPTFVLASATVAEPAATASRLIGLPVTAVTADGSPAGSRLLLLWDPRRRDDGAVRCRREGSGARRNGAWPAADGATGGRGRCASDGGGGVGGSGRCGGDGGGGGGGGGNGRCGGDGGGGGAAAALESRTGPAEIATGREEAPARDRPAWAGVAGAAGRDAAELLARFVAAGLRTVVFVRSRRAAEAVAIASRQLLAGRAAADRVTAYRGGYLAEERRAIERALRDGHLLGLCATPALELGVDVSGLDAVIMVGYPGSRAALAQQMGRAGRAGGSSLAVLVARDDPLDGYLVRHPAALLSAPLEATVLDPDNPAVLGPHLSAAAVELPLRPEELASFGPAAGPVVEGLVAEGALRRRARGWFAATPPPFVDLRAAGQPVRIVEERTGRLLGTVDESAAQASVHPGAAYIHQGAGFLIVDLDLADRVAIARSADLDYATVARQATSVSVVDTEERVADGGVALCYGPVEVTRRVVSFRRRHLRTGEVLDEQPLDLPERRVSSRAVWWAAGPEAAVAGGVPVTALPGALHAAEHAALALLPLFAGCDPRDVGGATMATHRDTGAATLLVFDTHPGAGFARRGFDSGPSWLAAAAATVAGCECRVGCPSCVYSPTCGAGNERIDKRHGGALLELLSSALSGSSGRGCR
jgi:DEAD/DEAH box helicase domain-containing protein